MTKGLFLGLTTVDIVFDVEEFPKEDSKNTARRHTVCAGGPATNAAITFSYLGGQSLLCSSIGKGSLAGICHRDLDERGVKHVDLSPERTSDPALSAILVSPLTGARTIVTSPALLSEGVLPGPDESRIRDADVLLFDGYEAGAALEVAKRARALGKLNVLDGDAYRPSLDLLLPHIDIVVFGQSFAVSGVTDFDALLPFFRRFGVRSVAATRGPLPIKVFETTAGTYEIPVTAERVVDTLGAGDIFHGALCYFLSDPDNIRDALKRAAAVASASVGSFGTRAWMAEHDPRSFEGA